jgi:hypothetical protein
MKIGKDGRNLCKMDTIGDAYIVISWLDDDDAFDERCADMLNLAGNMIQILHAHRVASKHAWHGRIGIKVGQGLLGIVGGLKLCFSVFGEIMTRVTVLEQRDVPGGVNCSEIFLDAIKCSLTSAQTATSHQSVPVQFSMSDLVWCVTRAADWSAKLPASGVDGEIKNGGTFILMLRPDQFEESTRPLEV